MNAAEAEIPQGGAEGMLVTQGGRFGAWPHLHSTARAASAGGRISVLKVDGKVVASEKMDRISPCPAMGRGRRHRYRFPVDDKN